MYFFLVITIYFNELLKFLCFFLLVCKYFHCFSPREPICVIRLFFLLFFCFVIALQNCKLPVS